MSPFRLFLVVSASSLILAATQPPQGGGEAAVATVAAKEAPSQPWAHHASDVPAAADVRFGTLPNGMRYAIMHNATPPGQAALRLRIDAGSLMENDKQLGLAHFTEHMAFNGTTNIPENELIRILERLGLAFGADTNAATGFDQTFYTLNLPRTDDETVDTSLHIMREQVSEAIMDAKAIDEERGVIAGEERTRNSPALRVTKRQLPVIAKNLKLANRLPIGDLEIIRTAPRERFVDFYQAYYRPSRATIIAVGDFDVAAMERKIVKTFGDWRPKAPDGAEPDLGKVAAHRQETHIFVEPGVRSSLSLAWLGEPDLRLDTVAQRRSNLLAYLGSAVINRRMGELSRTDNAPFLDATLSKSDVARSLSTATFSTSFVPGKWRAALEAVEQEYRRAVAFGVTQPELDREITAYRTSLQNSVAGVSTRSTSTLADGLLQSVNDRKVFATPQTNLDMFEAAIEGLTLAEVNAELKTIFGDGAPMMLVVSPEPIEGGEHAVAAAYEASRQVAVNAVKPPVKMAWPYTNFGKKGRVTHKRQLADLGATVVTFANGTVLTVKSTQFTKDRITIGVLTGGGERNFSPDSYSALGAMITGMPAGGLGKMTTDEMSRSLNGRVVGASLSTLGDKFLLSGGTRGADLQLEMQYLAAHLTDPAFRSTSWEQGKAAYPAIYDAQLTTPGGAFAVSAREILAGGDLRMAVVPPKDQVDWSMDALRPQLKALLADGPLHITIIGDVTVDQAIAVTAKTFGALPRRPATRPAAPGADQRRFPAATAQPLRFTHKGEANQALGYVGWPTVDMVDDVSETRRLDLLSAILRIRATEEIRERQALAYGANVGANSSDTYKGYGTISVQAQVAPDKLPAFFLAVDKIVRELREKPITEDELNRARAPLVENTKRALSLNSWWFANLIYLTDRPHYIPQVLTAEATIAAMTPADIQAMAKKYLRADTAWKAAVEPEDIHAN